MWNRIEIRFNQRRLTLTIVFFLFFFLLSSAVEPADVDVSGGVQGPHVPGVGRQVLAAQLLLRLGRPRPHGPSLGHRPPPAAARVQ